MSRARADTIRTAFAASQRALAEDLVQQSAATCEALRHQSLPFTSTAATAMRGSSAGATPMNHS